MPAIEPVAVHIEDRVNQLGRHLLHAARQRKEKFWARQRWEEGLFSQLMASERFRLHALRFVDVLPALSRDADLVRHFEEYFGEDDFPLPGVAKWGIRHAQGNVARHLLAPAVRIAMQTLGRRFIGGSKADEAFRCIETLRNQDKNFTLDLLGEATVSEAEAAEYQAKYLHILEELAPRVRAWKPNELLDTVSGRTSPRMNLSIKVSSLYSQISPIDSGGSADAIKQRLRPILRSARKHHAAVCLDMEHYDTKDITLRVFREIFLEPEFRDWPDVGLAMQAYLRQTPGDLEALIEWAKRRQTPVSVRLVRGAYWDAETVTARQNRWPTPVWTEKYQTDQCFEHCLRLLMKNHPHVETAVASHNVRSLALAMALAEELELGPGQYELQMLYGMADPLKDAIVEMGRRIRVYVPFGEPIPGMAYLVRRLLENTASQSFLRMGFAENLPAETLLAEPAPNNAEAERTTLPEPTSPERISAGSPPPFLNEPVHRFTRASERRAFADAIERVHSQLGRDYPLLIAGQEIQTPEAIVSVNPARRDEIVGRVASADIRHADAAIEAATKALADWRDRPAADRAHYLLKAAAALRSCRDEMAAWQILEAGKSWIEADADVVEAIDFLEYYARQALRPGDALVLNVPGEDNSYFYQPRGVGVIIPPWNFPLAILTGMLSAAVVTGNTVVLKPSSQTPVVAAKFVEILREIELPPGVVNFLPGAGSRIGDHLVRHHSIHFIAFTGSREVGTRINRLAAEIQPEQQHIKRVIAELGGKNAIIVDSDADVDDAVRGCIASAFGYQGQKCSAASRVIVVGQLYEAFLRRLIEAARSLKMGPPEDPANTMGPVINEAAREKLREAIDDGKRCATCVLETDVSHFNDGYYVGPTIFTDMPPDSPLAQEEFFGPIVAVMRADDFDHAIALANATTYALTGGVYSRSPANLERAAREFRVGNLYLNRKITGAVVGRQPFGGFKLSGVGSKAGGPDYLIQFVEPRTVTENTLRRGFAPGDDDEQM